MKVKSQSEAAQLCPTLSNPMACSLPGSSIHGISQARVLEWGAIAFSRALLYSPIKEDCGPSQVELVVKNSPANAGDTGDVGSIPGSGRSPGGGNGSRYLCLENPMDRGAWQAIVHGVTKSWIGLGD